MTLPTYPGIETLSSFQPENLRGWIPRLVRLVMGLLQGKMNVVIEVTLTASAAFTTVTDARIGYSSAPIAVPLTSNAAAELGAGTLYIPSATILNGSFVIQHANNSQTDRNFRFVVIG
ncbi:MAG: hypothetical protein KIT32_12305 [Rhodocyclaceae bacterium]|nr:hypothetical protein [Rhodocyclaceae bacterium]